MKYVLRAWLSLLLVVSATNAAGEVVVDTCGQTVTGSGLLAGDLDCSSGLPSINVVLRPGASLDLRGFTLTGDVICLGSCTVFSTLPNGTIAGGVKNVGFEQVGTITVKGIAVGSVNASAFQVRVFDSTISGTGTGIYADGVQITRSTITGMAEGIHSSSGKHVLVVDSVVSGNLFGILASGGSSTTGASATIRRSTIDGNTFTGVRATRAISIKDSFVTGNGGGLNALTVRVRDTTVSGNTGIGVSAERLAILRSTVSGNGDDGITTFARVPTIADSVITGNGGHGLIARVGPTGVVAIRNTNVSGNGLGAACGVSRACADVAADVPPRLRGTTTCGTSYVIGSPLPGDDWGVCALD